MTYYIVVPEEKGVKEFENLMYTMREVMKLQREGKNPIVFSGIMQTGDAFVERVREMFR